MFLYNREMPINMMKLDFVITAMKDYIANIHIDIYLDVGGILTKK